MRIQALPSSTRDPGRLGYLTSFLVGNGVAVDAGCLGFAGTPEEQMLVRDVFLTHVHADHCAGLPIFLENVADARRDGPTIHGSAFTLAALRQDVFNDRIWPNFVELHPGGHRLVRLEELTAERTVEAGGLRITPVAVDHLVPGFGYVVDDGAGSVLFSGDTGPTERIWQVARALPRLRAVFLELSFPDSLAELARRSGHLTPSTFAGEIAKLSRPGVRVIAYHVKARWREETLAGLFALDLPDVEVAEFGIDYEF